MERKEGPQRLRLFVAYRLPHAIVERVVAWQRLILEGATGVRPTPPESLHITMVFLGTQAAAAVAGIGDTVRRRVEKARRPSFQVWRYRETPRVGMLALTELALPGEGYACHASQLAGGLMLDFETAGIYERENRDWKPHITVVRFGTQPRLRPAVPELGSFSPVDVALYESRLSPAGSKYTVLASTPLAR
jgi:2'-5' RNA ligase